MRNARPCVGRFVRLCDAVGSQGERAGKGFGESVRATKRTLKEGFAVVDRRGTVTRIDQRTTGDQWEEIQKRLGGIDTRELISVADARDVLENVKLQA